MFIYIILCAAAKNKETANLYHESPYDPFISSSEHASGFLDSHSAESPKNGFGDVSIMTYNIYTSTPVEKNQEETINDIFKLLDEHHPTFLLLQGVSQLALDRLIKYFETSVHYKIALVDRYDRDMLTGFTYYLPIVYDSALVEIVKEGYFDTTDKVPHIYADYIEVLDKRMDDEFSYTVVNIDLFSTFNDIVRAEFFNIVMDARTSNVGMKPILMGGSMNTMPGDVKRMLEISLKNLIDQDPNNKSLKKTTMHENGNDDGQQRDFLMMRDYHGKFVVNYARILNKFEKGERYPVYGILSFIADVKKGSVQLNDLIHKK